MRPYLTIYLGDMRDRVSRLRRELAYRDLSLSSVIRDHLVALCREYGISDSPESPENPKDNK